MRLTQKTILNFPTPARGNKIGYDDLVKGLGLRVTAAGARSFILNYRINGRERRMTIGAWPEWSATAAREHAKELRRDIDRGEDPLAQKERLRTDLTFGELVDKYFEVKANKQKGKDNYLRMLKKDALPKWENARAASIKRRDVIALIEAKAATAPITANRLFELVRRIFNFAINREFVEVNPCAQVARPTQEKSRARVLSAAEICSLWSRLDGSGFSLHVAAALRLILATAQRPGEVASMRWEDLDLKDRRWTIPASASKNGLAHRVPLNAVAIEIIDGLPPISPWVLPSPQDREHLRRTTLAMSVHRARQRENDPLEVRDFTPHDLRRSAASLMASAGIDQLVIGRILNHSEGGVTKIYNRYGYDSEKQKALDVWDCQLRRVLSGDSAKVVKFSTSVQEA